jgi:hypothetical protein
MLRSIETEAAAGNQFQLLSTAHNELVNIYNKNTRAMQQAMQHLELRINALRLVVDDLVAGDVTLLPGSHVDFDPARAKVHWLGYHEYALKQMKEELAQVQADTAAVKEANVETLFSEPNQDAGSADVVFGG